MKILSLSLLELKKLLRNPASWGVIAALVFLMSALFNWQLSSYLSSSRLALEQGGQMFGVTQIAIKPFWGWALLLMVLMTPILCMTLINLEKNRRSFDFYVIHRVCFSNVVIAKFLALMFYLSIVLGGITLIPLSTYVLTQVDLGLLLAGFATVWLCTVFMVALSFLLCFMVTSPVLSLMSIYTTIFLMIFLPLVMPIPGISQLLSNASFIHHAHALMNGRVYLGDVLFYLLSPILLIGLAIKCANPFYMKLDKV